MNVMAQLSKLLLINRVKYSSCKKNLCKKRLNFTILMKMKSETGCIQFFFFSFLKNYQVE